MDSLQDGFTTGWIHYRMDSLPDGYPSFLSPFDLRIKISAKSLREIERNFGPRLFGIVKSVLKYGRIHIQGWIHYRVDFPRDSLREFPKGDP